MFKNYAYVKIEEENRVIHASKSEKNPKKKTFLLFFYTLVVNDLNRNWQNARVLKAYRWQINGKSYEEHKGNFKGLHRFYVGTFTLESLKDNKKIHALKKNLIRIIVSVRGATTLCLLLKIAF